ncbi:MAG: hypothetical protein WDN04_07560 [Rhodospirillales bacterium]
MFAAEAEPDVPPERLVTLAERLIRTLAVGRALVVSGRTVDMSGIQDGIGVLCAKTLDLSHRQGRLMLPSLLELAAQVDSLTQAMRRPASF